MRKFKSKSSKTTIEILLYLLEDNEEMSYIACTSSFDKATDLVKIRKRWKILDKTKDITLIIVCNSEVKLHIKSVILGLSLGRREFLLAIMWVSKMGYYFYQLYSKLFGVDIKFQLNQEERLLFRLCRRNVSEKNCSVSMDFFLLSNCAFIIYCFKFIIKPILIHCMQMDI